MSSLGVRTVPTPTSPSPARSLVAAFRAWTPLQRAFVAAMLALAAGLIGLLAFGSFRADMDTAKRLLASAPGCLAFVAAGLIACAQRPYNRVGWLMLAVGVAWATRWIDPVSAAWLSTAAYAIAWLWAALFFHLAMTFPRGRLDGRFWGVVVALTYVVAVGLQLARMAVLDTDELRDLGCDACINQLLLVHAPALGRRLDTLQTALGATIALAGCAYFVDRWRRSAGPERRALGPALQAIAAAGLSTALYLGFGALGRYGAANVFKWTHVVVFALVPVAFTYALVRSRMARGAALGTLLTRLDAAPSTAALDTALAEALDDRSLQIVYWIAGRGYCADVTGRPAELPADGSGRAVTYIDRRGQPVAAIIHDPWLQDEGDVVRAAGAAAGLWFQREQLEAELRMNVLELEQSRARLVRAGDEERRRIERDLHDGAQQRLSALLVRTRLERRALGLPDGEIAALLDEVERGLADSLGELRALAAGILPPVLSDFGLAAAIDELAARSPVPVDVEVITERLPAGIEVAAYFVVAEALANSLKHGHAARVVVRVWREDGSVLADIRDDGVGGVDPTGGTGLKGLADRVGALGGSLTYGDAPAGGAVVRAVLPCTGPG